MIKLSSYNDQWPLQFDKERLYLESVIGQFKCGDIEHVGSTAVVGLVAKPVIDIMFGVESLSASSAAIDTLCENGYHYWPYKKEVMHWFCKPSPNHRTHHLHLVPYNSQLWSERILFRDALRNNPGIAHAYAKIKLDLAQRHGTNRQAYTDNKWPFIKQVLNTYMNRDLSITTVMSKK